MAKVSQKHQVSCETNILTTVSAVTASTVAKVLVNVSLVDIFTLLEYSIGLERSSLGPQLNVGVKSAVWKATSRSFIHLATPEAGETATCGSTEGGK
jgi:hypothetical protein